MQEKDVKLMEIESENRKMKVELEEFRTEATHLKNQQATIRRLEERIRQLEQQVILCQKYLKLNLYRTDVCTYQGTHVIFLLYFLLNCQWR